MTLKGVDVALIEPLYEINIGYVARVMKNFCMERLYIVSPRCDVGATALKYSAHAQDLLLRAFIINDAESLFKRYDLVVGTTGKSRKRPGPLRRAITPEMLAEKVARFNGKVLVVFGREDIGLKNEELEMCDVVVTIPANPEYPILNLSHAAAIVLYEIYKKTSEYRGLQLQMPKREEVEVLLSHARRILEKMGKDKRKVTKALLTLKRIIGSCQLTSSDVRLLITLIKGSMEG